jgi:hypothetical protein
MIGLFFVGMGATLVWYVIGYALIVFYRNK